MFSYNIFDGIELKPGFNFDFLIKWCNLANPRLEIYNPELFDLVVSLTGPATVYN